jgi:hypothetical protein
VFGESREKGRVAQTISFEAGRELGQGEALLNSKVFLALRAFDRWR